jgi:hypothetical protein
MVESSVDGGSIDARVAWRWMDVGDALVVDWPWSLLTLSRGAQRMHQFLRVGTSSSTHLFPFGLFCVVNFEGTTCNGCVADSQRAALSIDHGGRGGLTIAWRNVTAENAMGGVDDRILL